MSKQIERLNKKKKDFDFAIIYSQNCPPVAIDDKMDVKIVDNFVELVDEQAPHPIAGHEGTVHKTTLIHVDDIRGIDYIRTNKIIT